MLDAGADRLKSGDTKGMKMQKKLSCVLEWAVMMIPPSPEYSYSPGD